MELHPHEARILKVLKQKQSNKQIALKAGLSLDAVNRALSWLATKGLVSLREEFTEEITLRAEGKKYALEGLPERKILVFVKKKAPLDVIQKKLGKKQTNIGLGWLKTKKQAVIEKGTLRIVNKEKRGDEMLLKLLAAKKKIDSSELTSEQNKALGLLKTRQSLIEVKEKKRMWANPTEKGLRIGAKKTTESISQLTPEMLISGDWDKARLREYDIDLYVKPRQPAKRHPLSRLIDEIRAVFLSMGFTEIKGPLIESAFWNFDALFQPQDHPARDMHDTFYLEDIKDGVIEGFDKYRDKVKQTHLNGGSTESTGWGGTWSETEARKKLLRTHTTAVTCRYLTKLKKKDLPAKVFSVGKTFRNEAIDYKHLPEFYQIEGIVVDESVNFPNLLGILREFYQKMGFSKVRFRPAYFPYTEMSVEPEIYLEEKKEWVELGGSGIFRPEVVKPLLGFDCPVLAWGLGLDRVAAQNLGLTDIRDLYISDLGWLRKQKVI
ncbi:MAG: phenylalanine--tRNA ligase subunit alpha [Candidatus Altiarchaeales archaeon ex4484_96]|nr:MAG: phenylalanine--tRNA ligase subunit alpha [Candidatus Altiarchaeales archaeon ex4484_96]